MQLGYNLLGNYDGVLYWLLAFLILGAAVTIDVVATQLCQRIMRRRQHMSTLGHMVQVQTVRAQASSSVTYVRLPCGVQTGRWFLNYVSLWVCVWLFKQRCLQVSLQTFLEPVK
jgi:hypothetical protein